MLNLVASCVLTALESYLLGSLCFGIIVSRFYMRDDVRNYGSGSAGMTNMLRTYGKKAAFFTLLGDFAKGVVAVILGRVIFSFFNISPAILDPAYLAGFFVLLGHAMPLYFGFKGGKGVATSMGIVLAINPVTFLLVVPIPVIVAFCTRIVSLASLLGAALYPVATCITLLSQGKPFVVETVFAALIGLVIFWLHRENIKRLINGTEKRLDLKKKDR